MNPPSFHLGSDYGTITVDWWRWYGRKAPD
jgi:hypothetical protein